MKTMIRKCPVCDNICGELLYHQSFILPDKHPLNNVLDIVSCNNCGCVYNDTISSQEEYNWFYKEYSKYEDDNISSGAGIMGYDKLRMEGVAECISKYASDKNVEILDIGTGNGGLLKILQAKGYTNLTGIDPSQTCVNNLIKKGINGIKGDVFSDELSVNNRKYDIVILSHVLEHIRDIGLAIKNIINLIKLNGILYIEVPDASRYKDYFITPYHYFDIEHINHFDRHSLCNLLKRYGIKLLECKEYEIQVSEFNYYPSVYVLGRKESSDESLQVSKSTTCRKNTEEYIRLSEVNEKYEELQQLVLTQEPVVIWGAGSYTMRMLSNTSLGQCNIKLFVDINANKQKEKINGIQVMHPGELIHISDTIIVASALYKEEIKASIKEMKLPNKVITL